MARRLETFPTPAARRYPWDEWLDGAVWELERGLDYTSKTSTLIANARNQAKKIEGRVRTRVFNRDGLEYCVLQLVGSGR